MKTRSAVISFRAKSINTEIQLTGSKSESNRALIIRALSNGQVHIENLSAAADTQTLQAVLEELNETDSRLETKDSRLINIGPAGTAMRFLTAYLSTQSGSFILTGSERMQKRPVRILTEALKELGADIQYTDEEGFPPLKITGPLVQRSGRVVIDGSISSQYISALLMIAPTLKEGLSIELSGDLTSMPYLEMTLAMLELSGISHDWEGNCITILPQGFRNTDLYIEPDWSAASYWYCIAAFSENSEIFLPGLTKYSLQGDSRLTEIMANFGITSVFKDGGVLIKKETPLTGRKIFDLKDCPDLAQTIMVCCAALGQNARFTGLETLKIKETDRIRAMQQELLKIGVRLIEKGFTYVLDCAGLYFPERLTIKTYEDHRMAMAFAPLAIFCKEIEIEDAGVVNKSYPYFWEDLKKAGFTVNLS